MIKSSFLQELDKASANAIRAKRMANSGFAPRNSPTRSDTFAKIQKSTGAVASQVLTFPEDLGSADQGHFIMFFINEQKHANVKFGTKGQKKYKTVYAPANNPSARRGETESKSKQVAVPVDNGDIFASQENNENNQRGKSTVSVKRAPTQRLKQSIAMYMPAQVSANQKLNYTETDIGALAQIANSFGTGFMKTGSFEQAFGAAQGNIESGLEQMAKQTLDVIAPGAKAIVEIGAGKVISNRLETVFKGLEKRSFQFQFTMMPKSENEANIVKNIVEVFRFYSAPSFEGPPDSSRVFVVPATFDIEYRINSGRENSYLNKISTCVLTNIGINYGGERTTFFRPNSEGAPPVQTVMTLDFQELEVITRERIAVGF